MSGNSKNKEKNVILINRMCTGTYTINNIGHEIINYFKADDGNVYIYILPYGNMDKKWDGRIKTILLTSALSNKRIEVIAKIDNPTQEVLFKKVEEDTNLLEEQKFVKYGGKELKDIFNYEKDKAKCKADSKNMKKPKQKNDEKDKAKCYFTFKVDPKNMKKPKGKHVYIINKGEKTESDDNGCKYIRIKKQLASTSLKQYFDEKKDKDDYDTICNSLDKIEWEDFNPEEIPAPEKWTINDENINFLQLIEKENEEQIYTNMMWYWFTRDGIFNEFLKHIECENLIDGYNILKEKVIPGGRTDILAIGEKYTIIIENKIMSGINGIKKDENSDEIKTQLSKYIKGITDKQGEGKDPFDKNGKIIGFIFIPDYREFDFLNEIRKWNEQKILTEQNFEEEHYKVIKYSELYKFFNKPEIRKKMLDDLYGKKYYGDFLRGLELQKESNISDKNKIEMKRKFMYAIKHTKDENK